MARCYSEVMPKRQSARSAIPDVWLVSDARNDAALETALARLPRGSGLIFRHYHLGAKERRARFAALSRVARRHGHFVALSGDARQARRWGADGAYGAASSLAPGPAVYRLVTAHSLREIAGAQRMRADAILLSPVHATRSHPGTRPLGTTGFRLLAMRARVPVIALGGMNASRAQAMRWEKWAAIDGIQSAM